MAIISTKNGNILVDDDKLEELSKYQWTVNRDGYTRAKINKKYISLHRYLTNCPKDMVVDHINVNKLDNRLENLEIITRQENSKRMYEHYHRRFQKNGI